MHDPHAKPPSGTPLPQRQEKDARSERLAEALRANLARRKAQKRARSTDATPSQKQE